jgi:hypothetical protein
MERSVPLMVKAVALSTILGFCSCATALAAADPVVTGAAQDVTIAQGGPTATSLSLKPNTSAYSNSVDIIYDIDLSGFGPAGARWSPRFGGGAATLEISHGSTPTEFAGQAIAGIEYAPSPARGLGRFIGTTCANLTIREDGVAVGRTVNAGYSDHAVLSTLR